jgi:hypothetical protein
MHFVEVGAWQGLKPAVHPKHLRGAEALLFHGKAVLVAFFSNLPERVSNMVFFNAGEKPSGAKARILIRS